MKKSKILLVLGIVFILASIAVFFLFRGENDKIKEDLAESGYGDFTQIIGDKVMAQKMRETEISQDIEKRDVLGIQRGIMMSESIFTHKASLADVSGGKATGIAMSGYNDGAYTLSASFAGLIEPQNGDYYEGWIVKQEPFEFLSTGRVEKLGGVYSNLYKSQTDLMEYSFYVLTIEPNDMDPAPGVHILEGNLIKK